MAPTRQATRANGERAMAMAPLAGMLLGSLLPLGTVEVLEELLARVEVVMVELCPEVELLRG
jgi:hypothetical protein